MVERICFKTFLNLSGSRTRIYGFDSAIEKEFIYASVTADGVDSVISPRPPAARTYLLGKCPALARAQTCVGPQDIGLHSEIHRNDVTELACQAS
jgi:hypothetical protein